MSQPPPGLSVYQLASAEHPGCFQLPDFVVARLRAIVDAAERGELTVEQARAGRHWFERVEQAAAIRAGGDPS